MTNQNTTTKYSIAAFSFVALFSCHLFGGDVTISASTPPRQQNGQQFYCPNDEPNLTASATPAEPDVECCDNPQLLETIYEWEGMLKGHSNENSQQLSSSGIGNTRLADVFCRIKWKWSCSDGTTEETEATGTWNHKIVANQPACTPQLSPANPVSIAGSGNFTNEYIGNEGADPATGDVWAKFFTGSVTNLRGDEVLDTDGPVETGTSCGGDFQPSSHGVSGSVSFSVKVFTFLTVGGSKSFSSLAPAQIKGEEFKRAYFQAFRQKLTPTLAFLNGTSYEQLTPEFGPPYGDKRNIQSINGDEQVSGQQKSAGYAGKECKSDCCPTGV